MYFLVAGIRALCVSCHQTSIYNTVWTVSIMGEFNKGEEAFGQLFEQGELGPELEGERSRRVDAGSSVSMFGPALAQVVVRAGVDEEEVLLMTVIVSRGLEADCPQDPMHAVMALLWLVRMFRRGGVGGIWDTAFRQVLAMCRLVPGYSVCPYRLALMYGCLLEAAEAMEHGESVRGWV